MEKAARLEIARKSNKIHREQGWSWRAIAEHFNKAESTLRNYRAELEEEEQKEEAGAAPGGQQNERDPFSYLIDQAEKAAKEAEEAAPPDPEKEIIFKGPGAPDPDPDPPPVTAKRSFQLNELNPLVYILPAAALGLIIFVNLRRKGAAAPPVTTTDSQGEKEAAPDLDLSEFDPGQSRGGLKSYV